MYKENIAPRLKRARKDADLTQIQVANKLKIHQSTLAGYETNRAIPDPETLAELAQLYCHTVDYFLGLADD